MTPATIIKEAMKDGVSIALSPTGTLKAIGESAAVNHWLPIIREQKPGILEVLRDADSDSLNATPADNRMNKVIGKLHSDAGLHYALESHPAIEPAAVILTVAIRGKGACELRIPKSRYDGLALLELIQRHTTGETLQ